MSCVDTYHLNPQYLLRKVIVGGRVIIRLELEGGGGGRLGFDVVGSGGERVDANSANATRLVGEGGMGGDHSPGMAWGVFELKGGEGYSVVVSREARGWGGKFILTAEVRTCSLHSCRDVMVRGPFRVW